MILFKSKRFLKKVALPKAWSYNIGLLFLRFNCALMLFHGWSKFNNFAKDSAEWPDPFNLGSTFSYSFTVFCELVCTLFLVFGLFTRFALFPLIVLLLVIVLFIHEGEPIADREHAILYLLLYAALFFTGPGEYSLDRLIYKKDYK